MKIKKLAAAVAITLPAGAALVGTGQQAHAYGNYCPDPYLCIHVVHINNNVATIQVWPYSRSFYGHFELQMPNNRVANSPTNKEWYAGSSYTFKSWNGGIGKWCVTAWSYDGGYKSVGYGCVDA